MNPPLYCTLCALPLEILVIEPPEGVNLGCANGHKFYYSPAHLEKGDILVIGELSFQCANGSPYPELVGSLLGVPIVIDETLPATTIRLGGPMGQVTGETKLLRG